MLWSKQTASVYTFSITAADKPNLLVVSFAKSLVNLLPKIHFLWTSYFALNLQSVTPEQCIYSLWKAVKNVPKLAKLVEDKITAVLDYGSLRSHNENTESAQLWDWHKQDVRDV